jgi:hypothetical protein
LNTAAINTKFLSSLSTMTQAWGYQIATFLHTLTWCKGLASSTIRQITRCVFFWLDVFAEANDVFNSIYKPQFDFISIVVHMNYILCMLYLSYN